MKMEIDDESLNIQSSFNQPDHKQKQSNLLSLKEEAEEDDEDDASVESMNSEELGDDIEFGDQ